MLALFQRHFPAPYQGRRKQSQPQQAPDVYKPIVDWFAAGNAVLVNDETEEVADILDVPGLADLVREHMAPPKEDLAAACELVLEGLHRSSLLAKDRSPDGVAYGDMLKGMFASFEE